jgi:TBC1 domain family member 2
VQGINDLVTPFFQVFLSAYIGMEKSFVTFSFIESDPETFDPGTLPVKVLESLESDSFWCLSALLDGIQVEASTIRISLTSG